MLYISKFFPPTTLPQEIHSLQLGSSSYAFHDLQKNSTANYKPSIQTHAHVWNILYPTHNKEDFI